MFDEQVVTKFVSDEDTLRDMVAELDLREAQTVFADVTARMVNAKTSDPQLCRESLRHRHKGEDRRRVSS